MIAIKQLEIGDLAAFASLLEIFKEVFENEEAVIHEAQLQKLLADPDFIVFVVKLNNQVIGGLTIYVLHRYFGTKPVAYIYDVGIHPNFQGKGYGKALIAEVCSFCRQNGFEDAYVEAESEDLDTVAFYLRTNFTEKLNATHFIYTFTDGN
jgi:aminoglycoside 3-N-acetyltransferase I